MRKLQSKCHLPPCILMSFCLKDRLLWHWWLQISRRRQIQISSSWNRKSLLKWTPPERSKMIVYLRMTSTVVGFRTCLPAWSHWSRCSQSLLKLSNLPPRLSQVSKGTSRGTSTHRRRPTARTCFRTTIWRSRSASSNLHPFKFPCPRCRTRAPLSPSKWSTFLGSRAIISKPTQAANWISMLHRRSPRAVQWSALTKKARTSHRAWFRPTSCKTRRRLHS